MKSIFFCLIMQGLCTDVTLSQHDTLYLDASTGNYIVAYLAHLTFIREGSVLKPFDEEVGLQPGQLLVNVDSLVQIIFEPATKIDPRIECTVTSVANTNLVQYRYRVHNGRTSRQKLNEVIVEFQRGISVSDIPLPMGWHSLRENDIEGDSLIPGVRWHWWGDIGLKAGKTWIVGGLQAESLPAIFPSYMKGKTEVLSFPDEGPSTELRERLLELKSFPANSVVRATVAPSTPPNPLVIGVFVDTLISYKHQALALGWIDNEGVANSLDQKLDAAKKKLVGGDSSAARNILQAFLNEVEAQKDKHLSSEAYALLKYNGEYLVDRLGGGQEEKKEK